MGVTEFPPPKKKLLGFSRDKEKKGGHYWLPWELVWDWLTLLQSQDVLTNPQHSDAVLGLSDKIGSQTLIPTVTPVLPTVGPLEPLWVR